MTRWSIFLLTFFCSIQLCALDVDLTNTVSRQTWDTESGLPQNTVQAILQTRDGYIWFATEGGLARFNSERLTIFNTRNTPQFRSNDIRALLEDRSGILWIATAAGIIALANQSFQSYTTDDGLPSNAISKLFEDANHRPCAWTASGAACFDHSRFISITLPSVPGLNGFDSTLQKFVASPVLCSYKDREGNRWIGTESSGVTVVRQLHFAAFSNPDAGLDGQVRCIYRDRLGAIWFGTDSEGLTRYSDGRFTRFTAANGLSSNVIVSLGEDFSGDLLIGTPDGLNRLHKETITVATSSEGLPDDFIRSIHTDVDGTVWIGTRRGLVRLHDAHYETFTLADGLGSDLIGSITRDAAGTLWVATLNGLSRLESRNHFRNFTTASGLSRNVITALFADHAGTLWIGTQGGGLNWYAHGAFHRVPSNGGLPDVIYGITEAGIAPKSAAGGINPSDFLEGRQANLWLASDSGVFRLRGTEVINYGVSDGLRVNECSGGGHPGIAISPDGGIWFATLKGAALLRPDLPFNNVPPLVVVESITIDNRTINHTSASSLELPPGASRLAFVYAALSFTAPQKVQFRYRLQGFDKSWIDAGSSRTASYTNLSPGRYTFKVIARNGDGTWNREPATMSINLQAHFYQTWWFAALLVIPLIGASYGIYQWRVARVEAQMESRFQAVLQERNRIAREIHDTLAQGFAGVSVQLELVSRKLGTSAALAREHLDQARMLVRSSLAEARRSIWELRAQSSEIEDLAARLSKMAAQMGAGGAPKIAVQVLGPFRPLPPRTEDELLRIAQEAVTNAIRHAQASQIDIELAFNPKLLRMTVTDNGCGFLPNGQTTGVAGHFGLKGMRERASEINAKLDLETAPGAGTKLSVEVTV